MLCGAWLRVAKSAPGTTPPPPRANGRARRVQGGGPAESLFSLAPRPRHSSCPLRVPVCLRLVRLVIEPPQVGSGPSCLGRKDRRRGRSGASWTTPQLATAQCAPGVGEAPRLDRPARGSAPSVPRVRRPPRRPRRTSRGPPRTARGRGRAVRADAADGVEVLIAHDTTSRPCSKRESLFVNADHAGAVRTRDRALSLSGRLGRVRYDIQRIAAREDRPQRDHAPRRYPG